MNIADQERIQDIFEFAETIQLAVSQGKDAYEKDVLRKLSIERLLISIGEASNKLTQEFKEQHPDIPWRDIISMRNLLIHAYERIDTQQVWKVAIENVPEMVRLLRS